MRCSAEARVGRLAFALALTGALAACGDAPPPAPTVGHSEPPRAVRTPPPAYPDALGCEGIGGRVDLRVTIEPSGRAGAIRILKSSGAAALDESAVAAVRTWEFAPATRGGKPVPFTISVPMTFNPPAERPDRCFVLDEQA